MEYKRIELGDGIGFSTVIDEKFKTSLLTVRFINKLSKDSAAAISLGMSGLSDTNSEYPTIASMSEAISELYSPVLGSFAYRAGDSVITGLTASWLDSRYALYGEDIQGEVLKMFSTCLFSPNVKNGEFDSDTFAITKQELLDKIDAELNSKRDYAIYRASSIAYKGEPAEMHSYGSREDVENVTSAQAYRAYLEVLETAQAEIIYVSSQDDPRAEDMLRKGFSAIQRRPVSISFFNPSPLKPEPVTVSEEFDVSQCKIVLAFKTSSDDIFALKMFSIIFGGLPVSKLFVNVREKQGLCYYCSCYFASTKNTLIADSGVERKNIEKVKAEIIHQLEEMQKGNFTDEDIEAALLAVDNDLNQVGDTPSSYSAWFFDRFVEGKVTTPAERTEQFRSVTRERIIEAIKDLKLDTVYLMLDKEVQN